MQGPFLRMLKNTVEDAGIKGKTTMVYLKGSDAAGEHAQSLVTASYQALA